MLLYNIEISVSPQLCACSSYRSQLDGGLEWLLTVIDKSLLGDLEARNPQVTLVEGLRLVVPVAILRAHLIRVQVLLSLPCGPIEEVHGRVEPTGGDCGLACLRRLHRVVMVEATLVSDLLAEVVAGLEPRVRERLSCRRGHLCVVHARVCHWQRCLTVTIVDRVHRRVSPWDACRIETK